MSGPQLERELTALNETELDALEVALRREKARRKGRVLSADETRLLQIVNQPMPSAQRFAVLSQKWEDEGLSDDERAELGAIVEAREIQNVERVMAVQQLSEVRGMPFEALWRQLMGETPAPLIPRN